MTVDVVLVVVDVGALIVVSLLLETPLLVGCKLVVGVAAGAGAAVGNTGNGFAAAPAINASRPVVESWLRDL